MPDTMPSDPVSVASGGDDDRLDGVIATELGRAFEIGQVISREPGARTILVRSWDGVSDWCAMHVFARAAPHGPEQGPEQGPEHRPPLRDDLLRWSSLDHPHLARVTQQGESPLLRWYLVSAPAGGSLAARLATQGPMTLGATLQLAAQIAEALQHAHEADLTHGALAATHVLLGADGGAVLTGFGFAAGVRVDVRNPARGAVTDQAALAALVYQCVTGDLSAGSREATVDYWRVPVTIRPVLQQARSLRGSSRYRDLPAFMAALRSAHDGLSPRATAGDRRETHASGPVALLLVDPLRPSRRRVAALVLLAVGLAIVAALPFVPTRTDGTRAPAPRPVVAPLRDDVSLAHGPASPTSRLEPRRQRPPAEPLARQAITATVPLVTPVVSKRALVVPRPVAPPPAAAPLSVREPTLTVSSRPWGVVSVDGRPIGNTPVLGAVLTVGPHRIRIERAGFAPHEVTVIARAGEDLRFIDIVLRELPR